MNSGQGTRNKILQEQETRNLEQDFIGTQNKEIGIRYYRNNEQGTRNREQGSRNNKLVTRYYMNREQGTRNLEKDIKGPGNMEKGTRNKKQGTRNKKQGTRNKKQRTRNKNQGTGIQILQEKGTRSIALGTIYYRNREHETKYRNKEL